jgi:glycosyltransferase involved in cell wall biosynthesis
MSKIKIYLQRPFNIADSAYYKYLTEYPAKNIEYVGSKKFRIITKKGGYKKIFWLKQFKRNLKRFHISIPNAYITKSKEKYDLIHCTHCLSKNKQPWVADFEFMGQFWIGSSSNNYKIAAKKRVRKYLNSKYCKKILAWSEWPKRTISKEFPEIKNKVEVVYPAVPVPKFTKIKNKNRKIKILFVGRDFEIKGGEIALKVMNEIIKTHKNVEGVVVSEIPKRFIKKYEINKKIKLIGLVTQKKLFEKIYPEADIFLYPTFSDTFGFAILEAQSFGLPIVAMKTKSTHTIEETIQEGKTGFIIDNMGTDGYVLKFDEKIIRNFVDGIEILVKDKKLREKMSKAAKEEIKNGKFSIKERNKKLKRIYKGVLK